MLSILRRHRLQWALGALLLLAALAAFGETLGHNFVDLDDGLLIEQNLVVHHSNAATIWKAFTTYDLELYIPLTLLSFQLDWWIGGGSALPFHATNLFLHLLNTLLVWRLLVRLLRQDGIAFFLALLFAVHPLQTEAVAWASARKDLLSTAFALGSIHLWLRWRETTTRSSYALSLLLFCMGLLAKVSIVGLPVLLALLDWLENRRGWRPLLPYAALAVLFGGIALLGKEDVLPTVSPAVLFLLGSEGSLLLLRSFILPLHLSPFYPADAALTDPASLLPAALAIFTLILLASLASHRHRGVTVGFWFAAAALAPSFLNAVKAGHAFAISDRYAYLALVGVLLVIGFLLRDWVLRDDRRTALRLRVVSFVILAAAVPLTLHSRTQAAYWHDSLSLYTRAVALAPEFGLTQEFLGNAQRRLGQPQRALLTYQTALSLDPTSAQTLTNLGHTLAELGHPAEARTAYETALRLNPQKADAYFGIGTLNGKAGKSRAAERAYLAALTLRPDYADASLNLGAIYGDRGETDREISLYQSALASAPENALLWHNLGIAYESIGQTDAAVRAYSTALTLRDDLPFARAALLRLEGTPPENKKSM